MKQTMHIRRVIRSDQQRLKDLKSAIETMEDPQDKLTAQCMAVLLVALQVGTDVDRLAEYTGYPRDLVDSISRRMREAKLWIGDFVDDTDWWDPDGNLTPRFFCHALVAQGEYFREPTEGGGCLYVSSETGEVEGEWMPSDHASHKADSNLPREHRDGQAREAPARQMSFAFEIIPCT